MPVRNTNSRRLELSTEWNFNIFKINKDKQKELNKTESAENWFGLALFLSIIFIVFIYCVDHFHQISEQMFYLDFCKFCISCHIFFIFSKIFLIASSSSDPGLLQSSVLLSNFLTDERRPLNMVWITPSWGRDGFIHFPVILAHKESYYHSKSTLITSSITPPRLLKYRALNMDRI